MIASERRFAIEDLIYCGLLIAIVSMFFGDRSSLLGFYSDDAGFIIGRPENFQQLYTEALSYVPGRNLHILWQDLIFFMAGGDNLSLATLHIIQSIVSSIMVAACYILMRSILLERLPSFIGACIFAYYPNHGEVQYWPSALPMNILSSLFVIIEIIILLYFAKKSDLLKNVRIFAAAAFSIASMHFLASFTYDQVHFVLAGAITLFCGYLLFSLRRHRPLILLLWGVCFSMPIGIAFWKKTALGNGPDFSRLNTNIIFHNLHNYVNPLNTIPPIRHYFSMATQHDWYLAALITISTGIIAAFIILRQSKLSLATGIADEQNFRWKDIFGYHGTILAGCGFFYLAAYGPAFIWYISPRHNYLPSVAVGVTAAALTSLALSFAERSGKRLAILCSIGISVAALGTIFAFSVTDLVQKQSWILTYSLRKDIYGYLSSSGRLDGKDAVAIEDVKRKSILTESPLFEQEQAPAVALITGIKYNVKYLGRYSLQSDNGAFLYINASQYNIHSLQFVTNDRFLRVAFDTEIQSRDGNFVWAIREHAPALIPPYHLTESSVAEGSPTFSATRERDRGSAFTITIPAIATKPGETLTLLPYGHSQSGETPATFRTASGEELFCPIDLSGDADGASPRYIRIHFDQGFPAITDFELGITGPDGYRPLLRTQVAGGSTGTEAG